MNRNLTLHAQIGVTEHEVVKSGKEEEDPVASRDYFRCQALSFFRRAYLDNVTLANPQLWEGRIAWAEAPSSLWEDPEFSETVRRILLWNRATS